MVSEKNDSKHVCVIGAGPAGLVSTREPRKEGHNVLVLEQNHDVGGQWLYDPKIMGFTDFPFLAKKGRDMRRFPGHEELLLYLKDFSQWFGLRDIIRFNTRVDHVGLCDVDMKWLVRSKDMKSDDRKAMEEERFDAVVVATGHYSHPWLPTIRGMDAWTRKQTHSHVYRVPEPFRNEIIGFPFFESQAKWIAQLLSGKRTLPSREDMISAIEEFYHSREITGIPKHDTHDICVFEYCDRYGDNCEFPHLEDWRKELCLSTLGNAETNLETYRDRWDDDYELLQVAHQSPHFCCLKTNLECQLRGK